MTLGQVNYPCQNRQSFFCLLAQRTKSNHVTVIGEVYGTPMEEFPGILGIKSIKHAGTVAMGRTIFPNGSLEVIISTDPSPCNP